MTPEEIDKQIKKELEKRKKNDYVFNCRFHPANWWHEVGCPHKDWTQKELYDALFSVNNSKKL